MNAQIAKKIWQLIVYLEENGFDNNGLAVEIKESKGRKYSYLTLETEIDGERGG